jgi:hypothetical protein
VECHWVQPSRRKTPQTKEKNGLVADGDFSHQGFLPLAGTCKVM